MVGAIAFSASAAQPGSVTGDSVRLRSQPSTDSEEIGVLNQGDTLEILDSSNDTWYQVSYTDSDGEQLSGYVSRDLVTIGTTAGKRCGQLRRCHPHRDPDRGRRKSAQRGQHGFFCAHPIPHRATWSPFGRHPGGLDPVGYSDGTSNYTGYISSDYPRCQPHGYRRDHPCRRYFPA